MIDLDILKQEKFLGCGCSTFGGSVSRSSALKTLETCFENNIFYFDIARSYGYGTAESIVGAFQSGKRDKIIISTKFGIEPPANFPMKGMMINLTRFVKNQLPLSSKRLHQAAVKTLKKKLYTPEMVIKSLNKSLSELKTSYLDILVYHEPSREEMLNDDIKYTLEKEIEKGKIRLWGSNVSGDIIQNENESISNWPSVIQHPFSLNHLYLDLVSQDSLTNIVYSVISIYKNLNESQRATLLKLRNQYSKTISLQTDIETLFYIAYQQFKCGIMLMSTSNSLHIKRNIEIASFAKQKNIDRDLRSLFI